MTKKWSDMQDSLAEWKENWIESTLIPAQESVANSVRDDILEGLGEKDDPAASLNPSQKLNKDARDGMTSYMDSIIIDVDGDGVETIHSVKISDPSKKDVATGMEIGKIAKAIEFGSSRNKPKPAWRRAFGKLKAKGIYKAK